MSSDFEAAFASLKKVFAKHTKRLNVTADTPTEYTLVTKTPSPLPQHKGHPMFFGSVRLGKAYVSFHLMPIYMNPALAKSIPPDLKKRMQGKTCFNFKDDPDPALVAGLKQLTDTAFQEWREKEWV